MGRKLIQKVQSVKLFMDVDSDFDYHESGDGQEVDSEGAECETVYGC